MTITKYSTHPQDGRFYVVALLDTGKWVPVKRLDEYVSFAEKAKASQRAKELNKKLRSNG